MPTDGAQYQLPGPELNRREACQAALALPFAVPILSCASPESAPLNDTQLATFETLAETLVPGARTSGVGQFINEMLERANPLLTYEMLGFVTPATQFYPAAMDATNRTALAQKHRDFARLTPSERTHLAAAIAAGEVSEWAGPPSQLVYAIVRSDAIDAVFGRASAYAALNLPYMAHIQPPTPW